MDRIAEQQSKFESKSQYSMFSLVDEGEDETSIGFLTLLKETLSNQVINIFIKDRFTFLLFYQYVVYCLLSQEYNFGYQIICK